MRRAVLSLLLALAPLCARAHDPSSFIDKVGFDQHQGAQVPLDAAFFDESGAKVALRRYVGRVPVVLALAYYDCDTLCGVVLHSVVDTLKRVSLEPGRDFQVVVVDIDPSEKPRLARAARKEYLARYGRPSTGAGWHFLTGPAASSRAVARAIGFRYLYDAREKRWAHPAGITILTPEGKVSRYLYGAQFPPRDLRLALVDASHGAIGSATDQLLLLCYHYDPSKGKYGFLIMDVLRAGGLATVAALGIVLVALGRRGGGR